MSNLVWIHKTAESTSLSHSEDLERLQLLSQAQRQSRLQKKREEKTRCTRQVSYRAARTKRADLNGSRAITAYPPPPPSSLSPSCLPSLRPPLSRPDWAPAEAYSVDHFFHVTLLQIMSRDRDVVFWKEMVPCLTQSLPAFRHLVVALSATHQLLAASDDAASVRLNRYALRHCNQATQLLRSPPYLTSPMLLASCILVAAYHLLRCDLESADRTIQSGLRFTSLSTSDSTGGSYGDFGSGLRWDHEQLKLILVRLGRNHGFKFWSPSVVYRFERSQAAENELVIDLQGCVRGPFVNTDQILNAYRAFIYAVMSKTLRNLAGGAFIDPDCALGQAMSQQLAHFSYYWDLYYRQLSIASFQQRLEAVQVRIGMLSAHIIVNAKVFGTSELRFDSFVLVYRKILSHSTDVLAAYHAGYTVKYLDRVVNGTLFTVGLCCRDPSLRRQAISLLHSQRCSEDGLVNWLRGTIIQMVAEVEEADIDVACATDVLLHRRVHYDGAYCRESDMAICLRYNHVNADRGVDVMESWKSWDPSCGVNTSGQEISEGLQGIAATFLGYGKANSATTPNGCVRPMIFCGRPVPVLWDEARIRLPTI